MSVTFKRGHTYRVLSEDAHVQTESPLSDYAQVAVYIDEVTDTVWVRPVSEFRDIGRFEKLS